MLKHLQTVFIVLLVSIVHEAFATKRKKMYFLLLVFVNFLVVVFSHYFVAIMKVINIVCINTTNFK